MAIDNAIRMLSFALLTALSASACGAQQTPAPVKGLGSVAGPAPAVLAPEILPEKPPMAPKVTCKDDQLTISADNSTLGSVLAAVHACLGIKIEIPEGASGSRTFEELGPGPERQVLASLLSGTDFDYIIGSSDSNPQKVEAVLLMVRTTDTSSDKVANAAAEHTLTPARRAFLQSLQNGRGVPPSSVDTNQAAEEPSVTEDPVIPPTENPAANPTPVPAGDTPPPTADAASAPPDTMASSPATAAIPSGSGQSVDPDKPVTERITDMQQLFEQRRQMQAAQGQNPTTPQNSTPQQTQP
jgi:hypothetical protein